MVINETALLASPVWGPIANVLEAFSVLVGGIFGLYIILIILRWAEYKKFGKILKDVRQELRNLNAKVDNTKFRLEKVPGKPKKSMAKRKK